MRVGFQPSRRSAFAVEIADASSRSSRPELDPLAAVVRRSPSRRADGRRSCRATRCRRPRAPAGRSRSRARPRRRGRARRRTSSSSRSAPTGRGRSGRGSARSSPRPAPSTGGSTCSGCPHRSTARSQSSSPNHFAVAYGSCGRIGCSSSIGQVVGLERPVREDEARHRLAREVDEAPRARGDRRLEHVERAQHVVAEDDVRRVVDRLRDRGRVDDDVAAARERVRGARVGQVGLPVVLGLAGIGPVPGRHARDRSRARRSRLPAAADTSARPTLPRAPVTRTFMLEVGHRVLRRRRACRGGSRSRSPRSPAGRGRQWSCR